MAGNELLHFLRGALDIGNTYSDDILGDGQPFYNPHKNYLTVGDKTGKKVNAQPITVKELIGYAPDTTHITPSKVGEYHIKFVNNNLEILTPEGTGVALNTDSLFPTKAGATLGTASIPFLKMFGDLYGGQFFEGDNKVYDTRVVYTLSDNGKNGYMTYVKSSNNEVIRTILDTASPLTHILRGYTYDAKAGDSITTGNVGIFMETEDHTLLAGMETYEYPSNQELASLDIYSKTNNIPTSTLDGTQNINAVIIQDEVEYIGENAFANTGDLNAIYIPESVERVGDNWGGSTQTDMPMWRFTNVVFNGDVPEYFKYENSRPRSNIFVPYKYKDNYREAMKYNGQEAGMLFYFNGKSMQESGEAVKVYTSGSDLVVKVKNTPIDTSKLSSFVISDSNNEAYDSSDATVVSVLDADAGTIQVSGAKVKDGYTLYLTYYYISDKQEDNLLTDDFAFTSWEDLAKVDKSYYESVRLIDPGITAWNLQQAFSGLDFSITYDGLIPNGSTTQSAKDYPCGWVRVLYNSSNKTLSMRATMVADTLPFIKHLNLKLLWGAQDVGYETLRINATQSEMQNKRNGWKTSSNSNSWVEKTVTVDLTQYSQIPGFDNIPLTFWDVSDGYMEYYPSFTYDLRCIPWFGPDSDADGDNELGNDAGSCKYIYNTCGAWDTLPATDTNATMSLYRQIKDIEVISVEHPQGQSLKELGNNANLVGFNHKLRVITSGIGGTEFSMSGNSLYQYCLFLGSLAYCKIGNINTANRQN